jgi:C4-dicarboxylate-specific signal transduction histidine kinase
VASFRARARTVDLLGRQQIAGIPTAISELFKNAHDAYATRVEVDFYRAANLLILRDDGLGMTRTDFEDRWLTLGTDSKVASSRALPPPPGLGDTPRPILGEKGIGRLAIASIGSQVLVLTRALRDDELSDLTVALVCWKLFELPGVNLDEIVIPIIEITDGRLPDGDDLAALRNGVLATIDELELTTEERAPLDRELEQLSFDPGDVLSRLGRPGLDGQGHGTAFLVIPTTEQLVADIDERRDNEVAPPLKQTLIGFANTMTPDSPAPRIVTEFRDRHENGRVDQLVGYDEFFTPNEFKEADHHIRGSFDAFGRFEGTVAVYGSDPETYEVVWPDARGRELDCGPFRFHLAYVQGRPAESLLELAEHKRLTEKLNQIGGIYIYRDGIRVQPYGNTDYDFLEIEVRRSRHQRSFFSYRRMFGVIELTSVANRALEEKAGREGFRQNRAYRQFRGVLQHLFAELAADIFSVERETEFKHKRDEVRRRAAALAENRKRATAAREAFVRQMEALTNALEDNEPAKAAAAIVDDLRRGLTQAVKRAEDDGVLASLEARARRDLESARARYALRRPETVGLSPDETRDWEWLDEQLNGLDEGVWMPTLITIATMVEEAAQSIPAAIEPVRRFRAVMSEAVDESRSVVEVGVSDTNAALAELDSRVAGAVNDSLTRMRVTTEVVLSEVEGSAITSLDDERLASRRVELQRDLRERSTTECDGLTVLADRLRRMAAGVSNGNGHPAYTDSDLSRDLDDEVLALREQAQRDLELAQLGLATEVISHELNRTVTAIRDDLRALHAWADSTPSLNAIYDGLRGNFDHLDNYLTLFTPLQRRLNRRRTTVRGYEIAEFLGRLFERPLEEGPVALRVTESFRSWHHSAFRSTLYPVFVNLVDNALYWVRRKRQPSWIRLDADGEALTVTDSGPGVPSRDRDRIWKYGWTRKDGGRGAGLAIAHDVLARDGWSIELAYGARDRGARFVVRPPGDDT